MERKSVKVSEWNVQRLFAFKIPDNTDFQPNENSVWYTNRIDSHFDIAVTQYQ